MGTEKPYGVIYCITCKVNGKVYIGQTVNFNLRMKEYKGLKCKTQPLIYNALKKHRVENFLYEIIDTGVSKEDLNELECYHMSLSDSRNKEYGYNTREGGSFGKHSEETKRKMSESAKGNTRNIGYKHTEEAKKNMAKSQIGHKGWNKGVARTEEFKKNISEKMKGRKASEEAKKNMVIAQRKRTDKRKPSSEETKKKRVESRKNGKGWGLHTKETRDKIADSLKGRKHSEEAKKKMSEAKRRNMEIKTKSHLTIYS